MHAHQHIIRNKQAVPELDSNAYDLAFIFGSRNLIQDTEWIRSIIKNLAPVKCVTATTAGEIVNSEVLDDTLVITLIKFDKTHINTSSVHIRDYTDSYEAGRALIEKIIGEDLCHVLVLSDGTLVNGSELVRGMNASLPAGVGLTGGLAGDGSRFEKTLVGAGEDIRPGNIVAVGFYGHNLLVGHGCKGGWDSFGPDRKITRAKDNVLYELDGRSALALYKEYLGELAEGLPGSALLFPLAIKNENSQEQVVRTILGINEAENSMTFAGNIPQGGYARLMRANFDRLIDAASVAANDTYQHLSKHRPQLAILISCVGRKLVLDQRVDEEIESVSDILGNETVFCGFYSYGEISPLVKSMTCELHNQTMTITTFCEV
ncbi:MAG: FIST C-terminal domain-containing protein [Chitinophagales bacterium]|nr:FIST C-terminal domain-containing protein [Chitinophagales bacterium]MDW8419520.1 FIST C-terminal domain-containing protein [Chitinophagales bacterium]